MKTLSHVMIVDDEPNVRLMMGVALEAAGYVQTPASDGVGALAAIGDAEEPIDLVILDLNMPVMGGMEVLRKLRATGSRVPVVVVTAHDSLPNAVEAMRLGAIDFLSKPITPERLRDVVTEVLERHHPPAQAESTTTHEPITLRSEFLKHLVEAKRALNNQWFDEAEIHLRQASALEKKSAEAHNLMGVLHELRHEHDASYREYKAALAVDANYAPAKHNMTRYYERFTFGRSDVPVDVGG